MKLLLHIILIFVFVFSLLMINLPHLQSTDYLMTKMYLFIGVFIFEFIIGIIYQWRTNNVLNVSTIVKNSLISSLLAVIGYSVYSDMTMITSNNYSFLQSDNNIVKKLSISLSATIFVTLGFLIESIFNKLSPNINDSLNKMYNKMYNK